VPVRLRLELVVSEAGNRLREDSGRRRYRPRGSLPRLYFLMFLLPRYDVFERAFHRGKRLLAVCVWSQARASEYESSAAGNNQEAKPKTHEQQSASAIERQHRAAIRIRTIS